MPNKFIPPQTTTATRTASTPLDGELLYDTDEQLFYQGDGTTVGGIAVGSGGSATLAGLTDTDVTTSAPSIGDTLVWNGTFWIPGSASGGREVLTANRTYYVRTDGSDSNDGLTDTAGGAFLTIQKAIDVAGGIDWSIYDIKIKLSTGAHIQAETLQLKRGLGNGVLTIEGGTTTATDTVIRGTDLTPLIEGNSLANITFKDLEIDTIDTASGYKRGLVLFDCSVTLENISFKGSTQALGVEASNSFIIINGISFSGDFYVGALANFGSTLRFVDGSTIINTATFSYKTIQLETSYCRFWNMTITGTITATLTLYSWVVQLTGKTMSTSPVTDSVVKTF